MVHCPPFKSFRTHRSCASEVWHRREESSKQQRNNPCEICCRFRPLLEQQRLHILACDLRTSTPLGCTEVAQSHHRTIICDHTCKILKMGKVYSYARICCVYKGYSDSYGDQLPCRGSAFLFRLHGFPSVRIRVLRVLVSRSEEDFSLFPPFEHSSCFFLEF